MDAVALIKKYASLGLLICFSIGPIMAQSFEDRWTGFFSFVSVRDIHQGNDKIYAGTENAVFTYDLSTQEVETITTINGLSGATLTSLYYSDNFNLLFNYALTQKIIITIVPYERRDLQLLPGIQLYNWDVKQFNARFDMRNT